jgi:choline dehydrogenase-like flavoprotein
MEQRIFEGKWEDCMLHASELAGKRVRITVLEEGKLIRPNEAMLAALQRARERAKQTPQSGSTEESLKLLRDGRAGKIFGYDPSE